MKLVLASLLCVSSVAAAAPVERRLYSDNIDASSFLWNDWNKFVENYHPNYIADDDPATAWVEGAKGSGAGEWLRIALTPLDKTTQIRLKIRNGYQKSKDLFKANARAKQVTITLMPSKTSQKVTLEDKDGWQDIKIAQPSGEAKSIEIKVDSVYEGTKYEDLCISDVQVFATSETPDNPAFEKSKHAQLMTWRAARLAAAAAFKKGPAGIPVYPAYAVTSTERESDFAGGLEQVVEKAAASPAFAKEWKDALAVAAATIKEQDAMARAQLAPSSTTAIPAADGLQIPRMQDVVYEGLDKDSLRLPMLGWSSAMFADQLRMLDVKDKQTPSDYTAMTKSCGKDVTWVRRAASKEATGPAKVQAVLLGRCGRIEQREGYSNERTLELYVYDGDGRIALTIGSNHIEGYRWVADGGKQMLAGGHSILFSNGAEIDAKKREAVAVK